MLALLLACTAPTDSADTAGTDTADSGGTSDTGHTGDSADTGELAYTHYMCTTSGTVQPEMGVAAACTGEAHLNLYEDGSLKGFASCFAEDEAEQYNGNVVAAVTAGAVSGTWTATATGEAVEVGLSGTVDTTSLSVTATGTSPAVTLNVVFLGEVL